MRHAAGELADRLHLLGLVQLLLEETAFRDVHNRAEHPRAFSRPRRCDLPLGLKPAPAPLGMVKPVFEREVAMPGHGRGHSAADTLDVIGMKARDEIIPIDAARLRRKPQEIDERTGQEDVVGVGVAIRDTNPRDRHGEFGLLEPFSQGVGVLAKLLELVLHERILNRLASQLAEGRSTRSMTMNSRGTRIGSSFNPSCSTAAKIGGAFGIVIGLSQPGLGFQVLICFSALSTPGVWSSMPKSQL